MSAPEQMPPETVAAGTIAAQSSDEAKATSTTTTDSAAETKSPATPKFVQPIVAAPDQKFFIKRMVIAAVVFAIAGWFFYDGFVKYPAHNQKVADLEQRIDAADKAHDDTTHAALTKELRETGPAHSDLNNLLQKIGGFPLSILAIYLLQRFLRESRGELRLENDTLHAPGHPPVPINAITGVQNARWDKKGIALFDYRLADGKTGRIRVDDFVFDRPPTDAIHDELIERMPKA